MNPDRDGPTADDEPLARPFLHRPDIPAHRPADRPHPDPPGDPVGRPEGHSSEIRPYLLTGGRTGSRGAAVCLETVVLATGMRPVRFALGPAAAANAERLRIVELAGRPCSTAEVAARLHLPLQVALVLVSDLVAEGLLEASAAVTGQSDDVFFLERLIAGVAAL